ncbi:MAG: hypothetical protein E7443_05225 [Ruminococcaceae bacterium]|nr:hypothetical protein [Oscillospiraceae bacterium]
MAGDALQKFGGSMSRAITKISIKTSSSLEKAKIKLHIESLTKDVQKMLSELGENVYSLWLNGEFSIQSQTETLEAIKQKCYEINQLTMEMASIDDRDSEILGTKTEAEQKAPAAPQVPHCPNCGAEHEPAAKFCCKCGHNLQ